MNKQSHYHNIQSSLLRFCSEFQEDMLPEGFNLGVVNLDAFTDEDKWPQGDFVGIGEFNVDIEELYMGQCMFAIATDQDTNLYRMGKLIQHLSGKLIPGSQLPIYDAESGQIIGGLYVLNGTRIGSPIATKTQPIQPVSIRFETDLVSGG